MTEDDIWKRLRRDWPGHAVRVEASFGGVDPGTPDTNLSLHGNGIWVELKVWGGEPISDIQLSWHVDAIQRGASAYVLVGLDYATFWVGFAETYKKMVQLRTKPAGYPWESVIKRFANACS